jgi:hypothetical protein
MIFLPNNQKSMANTGLKDCCQVSTTIKVKVIAENCKVSTSNFKIVNPLYSLILCLL